MSLYSDQFLDQIKAKINLVDLISNYITTQKKGRDYWACCPFHNEKTPSFQIKEEQQFYKCYGCGKNGNIFTFVMEYEKLSFPEAVEFLANKANIKIPTRTSDEEYNKIKKLKEKIYNINKETAIFYHNNLKNAENKIAMEYLTSRGIISNTITKFGLGYSPDFDSLIVHLTKLGYDKQSMVQAGVASQNDKKETFDFFAKRLIIPIIDGMGKIIGFSGRLLEAKPEFAKYKNTPTTLVFNKGKSLFGINIFKRQKHSNYKTMLLVEGHMDVISLSQYGFDNVVASMGTALTSEQCREIKRYASKVYVSFDGDSAGQEATLRGLDLLKNEGLEVMVVGLTDNLDPDDYVKKFGKEQYEKLIVQSLPLIDFKLKKVEERHKFDSYDNKLKYAREAIVVLSDLDAVEREVYVQLVSKRSGLSSDTILNQVGNVATTPPQTTTVKQEDSQASGLEIGARFVLSSMLFGKEFALYEDCETALFEDERHKKVCEYLQSCAKNAQVPQESKIYDILEQDIEAQEIINAIDSVVLEGQRNFYKQSVQRLRKNYVFKEVKRLVAELQEETDVNRRKILEKQINDIAKSQAKN